MTFSKYYAISTASTCAFQTTISGFFFAFVFCLLFVDVQAQSPELFLTELPAKLYVIESEEGTDPPCGIYQVEFAVVLGDDPVTGEAPETSFFITNSSWLFEPDSTTISITETVLPNGNTRISVQAERDDLSLQNGDGEILRLQITKGILIALEDFPDKRGNYFTDAPAPELSVWVRGEYLNIRSEQPIRKIRVLDLNSGLVASQEPGGAQVQMSLLASSGLRGRISIVEIEFQTGEIMRKKMQL